MSTQYKCTNTLPPQNHKNLYILAAARGHFLAFASHLPRTVQHKILAKWETENMQREGLARNCHYILCYTRTAYNTVYIYLSKIYVVYIFLWIGLVLACLFSVHKRTQIDELIWMFYPFVRIDRGEENLFVGNLKFE